MFKKLMLLTFCIISMSNCVLAQYTTQINWVEFYPLHIGDFWKYTGKENWLDIIKTRRVVGIDTMPDGKQYARIRNINHIFNKIDYNYERVDSLGDVYEYAGYNNQECLLYKFNVCVGDTWPALSSGYWKVIEKFDKVVEKDTITCINLAYYLHGEEWPFYKYLEEGSGLTYYQGEGVYYGLVASFINGIIFGDTTTTTTNIKQTSEELLPHHIILHQNYPNPFNQTTKICYEIYQRSDVTAIIYNLKGEIVKQILNQTQDTGVHGIYWDGKNENEETVSSGTYFFQMRINNNSITKSLLLIR